MDPREMLVLSKKAPARLFDRWKLLMFREARGFSQQQLADAMELWAGARNHISNIETGHYRPGKARIARLAKALAVQPEDLMSDPADLERSLAEEAAWRRDRSPDLATWMANQPRK